MSTKMKIEPVVKRVSLQAPADKAFRHFTDNMHLWWPLASHSLSLADAKSVVFEAKEGGRIYEIDKDGCEREWGRVTTCRPPHVIVFSWVLEAPEKQTEVEVRFRETGEQSCVMTLEHRGWENREDGAEWRERYYSGWDVVLGGFEQTLAAR